ncbi:MAG: hypothetical protein NUW00_01430 [Candidatus Kaiserbacteria bacterium]|nr:hypothetical protein [Candidatus Kaiserbacteria bacterium]
MKELREGVVSETRKKMSETIGELYKQIIEGVLCSNSELDDATIEDLLRDIPEHAKRLCFDGLMILRGEIGKNKNILNEHEGEEKEFIINEYIQHSELEKKGVNITDINDEIKNCTYTELAGGIPLIGLTHSIWTALRRAGTGSPDGWTTSISNNGVSFIFYPLLAQMKESDLAPWLKEHYIKQGLLSKKHELHHFIWGMLERGGFARESNESSSELREAFLNIRHELIAHIFSESGIENAIFAHNPNDSHVIDQINSIIGIFSSIGNTILIDKMADQGTCLELFFYPIMKSRNFNELRDNLIQTAKTYNIRI